MIASSTRLSGEAAVRPGGAPVSATLSSARRVVGTRRRALIAAALVVVLIVAWLAVAVRAVVFPHYDEVGAADAIVVLGPVDRWRVEMARDLVDEGVADTVAMSSFTHDLSEPFCDWEGTDVETVCYTPAPSTTQGEAQWVKQQAAARGWERVIVITVGFHVERARYIFEGCLDESISVAVTGRPQPGATPDVYVRQTLYQSGGFLKAAFVTKGC